MEGACASQGLLDGVLLEGRPVLNHIGHAAGLGGTDDLDAQGIENLADFTHLVRI